MSTSDLDDLRGRWAKASRRVDEHLQLDVAAMRAALSGRRRRATGRLSRALLFSFVINAGGLAALAAFIARHRDDGLYVFAAAVLVPLVAWGLMQDLRHWRVLRRLDFSAPVLQVRAELDAFRRQRLRFAKGIFLASVPLWWPFVWVLMKGMSDVDLMRAMHPSVLWVTLGVGLAFIPLARFVAARIAHRYADSPAFQQFLGWVAGEQLSDLRREVDAQARFEQDLESGELQDASVAHPRGVVPPALAAPIRALRWRTVAGIVLCVGMMLAIGLFNAKHAGQWQYIVPGIVLNLVCVGQLVSCIFTLIWLTRIDYGAPGVDLVAELTRIATLRARVARATLVAVPLIAVLLAQVLVRATLGGDVFGALGGLGLALTALVTIAAGYGLHRVAPRAPDSALLNGLALGSLSGIRRVLKLLAGP